LNRRSAVATAVAFFLCGGVLVAAAQPLFLDVVPATLAPGVSIEVGAPLRVAVFTGNPNAMATQWRASLPVQVFDDRVVVDLVDYPVLDERVSPKQRRPSFLIDFDEPPMRDFAARMRRKLGKTASRGELARVVDEEISTKTRARGFDMASTVARRHEGDCTEHAVLLAALARARGLPARVVMGVAIVVGSEEVAAYGHAWTEIHDGTKWHRADATRIHKHMREEGKRVRYLPVLIITDEGPGYEFKYVSALQARWFDRLEVLGNAPAAKAGE